MNKRDLNKKIIAISYTEFWDRLNYYGLQAVLILFLINRFGFTDKKSYIIYGVYTALSYGFCIIGGIIADKLLGLYYSILFGSLFISIGNLFLISPNLNLVYLGLAIITTGISILKPNNPNLLGSLFKSDSVSRAKTFSLFYLCINIGSILGPIIYGAVSKNNNYWASFLLSFVGLLTVSITMLMVNLKGSDNKKNYSKLLKSLIILIICIGAAYGLFLHPNLSAWVLDIVLCITLLYIGILLKNFSTVERANIYYLTLPFFAAIIFFTFFLQIYSSLTLFVDRYFDKSIGEFQIPTTWFSSIEPICIIFAVPILNYVTNFFERKNLYITDQTKVALGLMLAASAFISFSLLPVAISFSKILSFIIIFLANMLLAFGELWIIPVTMSLTNNKAPQNYKGTFMGLFYFSLALSGYLSGIVSKYSPKIHSPGVDFSYFFIKIAATLFIFGVLLTLWNNISYHLKNKGF